MKSDLCQRKAFADGAEKPSDLNYSSPLLCFRAYRFSSYFRTKENLTLASSSFSHKLNPRKVLCKFDLQGKCNDEECRGQHQTDYTLSELELVEDLISYCPGLAGVDSSTPVEEYHKAINTYAENITRTHAGKMTSDELLLLLTSKVVERAGHVRPFTMFYEPRKWRPEQKNKPHRTLRVDKNKNTIFFESLDITKKISQGADGIISEEDMRYFGVDDSEVQDMEGAVLEDSGNIALWLKLAYKKLGDSDRGAGEGLNKALNVLARGLEANKHSSELWYHYLLLYQKHVDSTDILDLFQTALQFAPSYPIWWQYLKATKTYGEKKELCDKILDFVKTECQKLSGGSDPQHSHQLLETLLYSVTLDTQAGYYSSAVDTLKEILKPSVITSDNVLNYLLPVDKCVLWTSYIHLLEFHTLPHQLYDPSNQNPGKIVCKEQIVIPWHTATELLTPVETLVSLLWEGVEACCSGPHSDNENMAVASSLLHDLVLLLKSQSRWEDAFANCRKMLKTNPSLVDIWLSVADLYVSCGSLDCARNVFSDAIDANSLSAKLYYHLVNFEISQGESDKALEHLEHFILSHFVLGEDEMRTSDPNILFSLLLGLTLPLPKKKLPSLVPTFTVENQEQKTYLWLNYCLLLELQGAIGEAIEMYEKVLSSIVSASQLHKLWISYVEFLFRQIRSGPSSPVTLQQLHDVIFRSVTTMPTQFPLPHCADQYWTNYSYVNNMIDSYLVLLSSRERLQMLERFLELMPSNVELLLRLCEEVVSEGELQRAQSVCNTAVYEKVANIRLWKMVVSLAQKLGSANEVERLYLRAVQVLPFSVTLWKDLLLFEVTQGNADNIQQILIHCKNLGLNVQGFVATISS